MHVKDVEEPFIPTFTSEDFCESPASITPTSTTCSRRSETGVWCSNRTVRRLRDERAVLLERLRINNRQKELNRLRPGLHLEVEAARNDLEMRRLLLGKLAKKENELLESSGGLPYEVSTRKQWQGWGREGSKSDDRLSSFRMDIGEALKTLM